MFRLATDYKPSGDQPEAIKRLTSGLETGLEKQTLLGVTGSGKTFTMANVIQNVQHPVLIISHNKTLAAQLFSEFKSFFPDNAVEYFISYYDYYLPESYIPQTDTYIAKDASINDDIEKLRLSATTSLMTRKDVIIVASVSCIYGLGSPDDFRMMSVPLKVGASYNRKQLLKELINIQYNRNDVSPKEGQIRVRGDVVDIYFAHKNEFLRASFWDEELESLSIHESLTGKVKDNLSETIIPPVKHFVIPQERIAIAEQMILEEMKERVKYFEESNLLVEAQRIYQRTMHDMEMLKEIGYCSGIENYSRHLGGREPGSRPHCLIDFFPRDFLLFIDESHVTIPQLRAMFNADRSRKQTLVDHGFRLPSALDNRPLSFDEFERFTGDTVFVSATPADYESNISSQIVEQVVRPTGLLDPLIEIRPLENQVDDVIGEVRKAAKKKQRVLITTLTKKSSERLSDYLLEIGIRAKYIHSEIDALQRVEILNALRKSDFDCLIGVNLLREGLDLPEVALVAILDADKEGFLRSEKSLVQTAGRAARNVSGKVIFYADKETDAIKKVVSITSARREKQKNYNLKHNIIPKTVVKEVREDFMPYLKSGKSQEFSLDLKSDKEFNEMILSLEKEMLDASEKLEFERAAFIRDKIKELKEGEALDDLLKGI